MGRARLTLLLILVGGAGRARGDDLIGGQLRRVILDEARDHLAGELTLGPIEVDLPSKVVVQGLAIKDTEGQEVIRVGRLELLCDPFALLKLTVRVQRAVAEGVSVRGRTLSDGRLNLAALGRPRASSSSRHPKELSVRFEQVILDGELRVELDAGKSVAGSLHAEGTATLGADGLALQVSVRGRARQPLDADLSGKVALRVGSGGVVAEALRLAIGADGGELNRLLPGGLKLRGRWALDLNASGPFSSLAVRLEARPPKGQLELRGTVGLGAATTWRLTAEGKDIDPASAWIDAPPGTLSLAATGHGVGGRGVVDVTRFLLDVTGARARASGHLDVGGERVTGRGTIDVDATDLSHLGKAGPGLAGALTAHIEIDRPGGAGKEPTRVDADVEARNLVAGPLKVARAEAHLHTVDVVGKVRVSGHGLSIGGSRLRLDEVTLVGDGEARRVGFDLRAQGSDRATLRLAAHGKPVRESGRLVGIDGAIDELLVGTSGENWRAGAGATLRVAPQRLGGGKLGKVEVLVRKLGLTSAGQRLDVAEARYRRGGEQIEASLSAQKLDVARLGVLLSAGLPPTRLDGTLKVSGTLASPAVVASLRGELLPHPELAIERMDAQLELRTGRGRLSGALVAAGATTKIDARFDLPATLGGVHKLQATGSGQAVPLRALRPLLPPAFATLEGSASLTLRLAGDTRKPELAVTVDAPAWSLGPLGGSRARLALDYRNLKLQLDLAAEGAAGKLTAKAQAPLDLDLDNSSRRALHRLVGGIPFDASASLKGIDLARLPVASLRGARGLVDATAALSGTLEAPRATLLVDGRRLAPSGSARDFDLHGELAYADKKATFKGYAGPHSPTPAPTPAEERAHRWLRLRGDAPLDLTAAIEGGPWRTTPMHLEGRIEVADLAALAPPLAGGIQGLITGNGTLGDPVVSLEIGSTDLRLGATRFRRLAGTARLQAGSGGARASLQLSGDAGDGTLGLDAVLALDAAAPLRVTLKTRKLRLDLPAGGAPRPLNSFAGLLETDLVLDGSRDAPRLRGSLRVDKGKLLLLPRLLPGLDPLAYEDLHVELVADDEVLTLRDLSVTHAGGKLRATALVPLDGLRPFGLEGTITVERFPLLLVDRGVWGAWVDGVVDVHAEGGHEPGDEALGPRIRITVLKGAAQLPRIDIRREAELQPLGRLTDVRYADSAARADAAQAAAVFAAEVREAAAHLDPVTRATIDVRVPGPLYLRSPESGANLAVDTALAGDLKLELRGRALRITGAVDVHGKVLILGRAYSLERGHLSWDGVQLEPTLDLRATREFAEVQVVITLRGTPTHPDLDWFSHPAYDRLQVERMIISGDPDGRSSEGALSNILFSEVLRMVVPQLRLDDLRLRVTDVNLQVGYYIIDTLYVSYVRPLNPLQGLRPINLNQIQLEWRPKPRWLLQLYGGDAGILATDVFYNQRY